MPCTAGICHYESAVHVLLSGSKCPVLRGFARRGGELELAGERIRLPGKYGVITETCDDGVTQWQEKHLKTSISVSW